MALWRRSCLLFKSLTQIHVEAMQTLETDSSRWDWAAERCMKLLPRMEPSDISLTLWTVANKHRRDQQLFFQFSQEIIRREEAQEGEDIPPALSAEDFARALDANALVGIKNEVLLKLVQRKIAAQSIESSEQLSTSVANFIKKFNL
eukprot:GEMP01089683.1.p2 GENE.GEMP01089683.1~~GEMP01089683.1.p2  ORF type:complete len:147 (+),score=34.62 GEMP01089683.1:51-491(+)